MGGLYQMYDAYCTATGTQFSNRQFDHMAYANSLAGGLLNAPNGIACMNAKESPRSRAFRLLSEAKARHPEWEVKKLQKPLGEGDGAQVC